MKDTQEESATLKEALKHEPATEALAAEAGEHPEEADEAFFEVQDGRDTCEPDSWVAIQMRANHPETNPLLNA